MHQKGRENISDRPDSYRDSFPDEALIEKAEIAASETVILAVK